MTREDKSMPGLEALLGEIGVGDEDGHRDSFSAKASLESVRSEVEKRVGKTSLYARYHRAPRLMSADYEVTTEVLGTGLSGVVKVARSKHLPGFTCAVKHIPLADLDAVERRLLEAEVQSFMCMDHPHIARLIDVYESDSHLSLVMECMEGGELVQDHHAALSEPEVSNLIRQILLAISYIHSRGVVHRDIKPSNILFDKKGGKFLKLIDFGLSKMPAATSPSSPNVIRRMDTTCGTEGFIAPEVSESGGSGYSNKCDLWSVGIIAFLLLTGHMPNFPSSPKLGSVNIESELGQTSWQRLTEKAKHFTLSLLQPRADDRMSARDALHHDWINSIPRAGAAEADLDPMLQSCIQSLEEFSAMPPARRCLFAMVPWSLTNEEQAKVRDYFLLMDMEQDGIIVLSDLRDKLTHGASKVFAAMDTNRRGEVFYSEFLAAMVPGHIGFHDALLRATFNRFDVKCTRRVTLESLRYVLGDKFDGVPVEILMNDLDNRGSMSYETFTQHIRNSNGQHRPNPACCTIH